MAFKVKAEGTIVQVLLETAGDPACGRFLVAIPEQFARDREGREHRVEAQSVAARMSLRMLENTAGVLAVHDEVLVLVAPSAGAPEKACGVIIHSTSARRAPTLRARRARA